MLTLDRTAPGAARRLVRQWIGAHPRVADAELAVSELVTNTLLHTTAADVELSAHTTVNGGLRVSVRYTGDAFTGLLRHESGGRTGSGLLIVQSVADRWGLVSDGTVDLWFEVS
jgi:anti-sigma regulatory factor (Ser/Thr protein kinase)